MKTWVTRIFGMLNLIFTAGGFWYFANLISWNLHRWPGDVTKPEWSAFIVVTMLSITMLGTLGYAGVRLLRKDEAGIRLTALVCSVEILCIYMVAVSPLITQSVNPHGLLFVAIGPLHPQGVTGYPLVALIVMLILLTVKRRGRVAHTMK